MIDRRSYLNAIESDISDIKTDLNGLNEEVRKTKERISWCKEHWKIKLLRMCYFELRIYKAQKKELLKRKQKLQKLKYMAASWID